MTEKNILPSESKSYWREINEIPSFPSLPGDIETDVVIVGAGLTGVTAAYLLRNSGLKVVVVEGRTMFTGTTAFTTAKVTAQHSSIYQKLISTFGEEKARLYYEANMDAKNFIELLVSQHNINCGYEKVDAYIFAETDDGMDTLKKEMEAYQTLGIKPSSLTKQTELPFPVKSALKMENQGQFHPLEYLKVLIQKSVEKGVQFFEQSRAKTVSSDSIVEMMDGKKIKAKKILVCSHFPFNDGDGLYFARMHPERSYIVAAKARENDPKGMYINAEKPTRSLRNALGPDGTRYLLIGGEGHITGRYGGDTTENYEKLAMYGREQFHIESFDYRWSAQDLVTLDQLPYVGPMTSGNEDVLVATGYAKWGMTNSTVAARIMADNVLGKENPYAELYSPTRSKLKKEDISSFTTNNASVAKEFIKGKTEKVDLTLDDLKAGTGDIGKVDGKKVGAYKDNTGKVYLVKPVCTHMGCDVAFNHAETSWDCPCHGSRFSYTGDVLEGPAFEPLEKLN